MLKENHNKLPLQVTSKELQTNREPKQKINKLFLFLQKNKD